MQKFADVESLDDVGVCTTTSVLHIIRIPNDYDRVVLLFLPLVGVSGGQLVSAAK